MHYPGFQEGPTRTLFILLDSSRGALPTYVIYFSLGLTVWPQMCIKKRIFGDFLKNTAASKIPQRIFSNFVSFIFAFEFHSFVFKIWKLCFLLHFVKHLKILLNFCLQNKWFCYPFYVNIFNLFLNLFLNLGELCAFRSYKGYYYSYYQD